MRIETLDGKYVFFFDAGAPSFEVLAEYLEEGARVLGGYDKLYMACRAGRFVGGVYCVSRRAA
jgi:hypothetical protein